MPYTRKRSEVTEEMPCRQCDAWIPSDEQEWIAHVVVQHGVTEEDFAHNIARLYPDSSRKREIAQSNEKAPA